MGGEEDASSSRSVQDTLKLVEGHSATRAEARDASRIVPGTRARVPKRPAPVPCCSGARAQEP